MAKTMVIWRVTTLQSASTTREEVRVMDGMAIVVGRGLIGKNVMRQKESLTFIY